VSEKDKTTKRLAGIVCALHGTFEKLTKCPICVGFHANGGMPSCSSGCGTPVKQVRRFAFTLVVQPKAILVGRCDEGTRGYTPLPELGTFQTAEEIASVIADLNRRAGLDERAAVMIAVGTMHTRESELVSVLKRALVLMKQVQEGTADQDEVDEWADDARQAAQV
jgi:hypothetical protein